MTTVTANADIARDLIRRGLRLVPAWPVDEQGACTCHDRGCYGKQRPDKAGKHPRRSLDLPSAEAGWWEANPAHTVLIDRKRSGLVTVEDDGQLAEWAASAGITLPPTLTLASPAGRLRFWYWLPAGFAAKHNHVEPDDFKVDVECLGTAPGPGVRNAAGEYKIVLDQAIAPAPHELVAWLEGRAAARAAARAELRAVTAARPEQLPDSVRRLLDDGPEQGWKRTGGGAIDRSEMAHAIVMECFDAGMTADEAAWTADSVPEVAEKYGGRTGGVPGQVAEIWAKAEGRAGPEPGWLAESREPSPMEAFQAHRRHLAIAQIRGITLPELNGQHPGYSGSSGRPDTAGAPEAPGQGGDEIPEAARVSWPPEPFTDDAAALAWAQRTDPGAFFGKGGIRAQVIARAVAVMGPLARGIDRRTWAYRRGVYVPDNDAIAARATDLLGNLYRPAHATVAEHVVLAHAPVITSDPVEQFINTAGGLLDWRSGTLYPHDPRVLSTVQLGTWYDPAAQCPVFDWWLSQVVPPDCIELMWELTGYLCYSGNPLHVAVMLSGDGRNGKGTYLRAVKALLGERNVTSVSLQDLVTSRWSKATLFGKIANLAGDIDATYLESTAVLKAITGNNQVSAEFKNRDLFDFTPWAVPVFSANKTPASADVTAGYLSRWLVIPFPYSFAGREDRSIEPRLHAELPGILASAMRRLPPLLARGQFALGDSAREAKAAFERRTNQVRYWLHECCEVIPATAADAYSRRDLPAVNRAELFRAYQAWVFHDGGKALKAGEFYDRLRQAGIPEGRNDSGTRVFYGIRVTATPASLFLGS